MDCYKNSSSHIHVPNFLYSPLLCPYVLTLNWLVSWNFAGVYLIFCVFFLSPSCRPVVFLYLFPINSSYFHYSYIFLAWRLMMPKAVTTSSSFFSNYVIYTPVYYVNLRFYSKSLQGVLWASMYGSCGYLFFSKINKFFFLRQFTIKLHSSSIPFFFSSQIFTKFFIFLGPLSLLLFADSSIYFCIYYSLVVLMSSYHIHDMP